MNNTVLWLISLPRRLHMIPHVRAVDYWPDFEVHNEARCGSLQFCFRLGGDCGARLKMRLNGESRQVGFPHLMIKYPGDGIQFDNATFADCLLITYQAEATAFFTRQGLPPGLSFAEFTFPEERFREVLAVLADGRSRLSEPGVADRIDLACYSLIHESLLRISEQQTPLGDTDQKILKIASYFQLHYAEKIDLDLLVRQYGFSRRTFLRHWARNYRETPGEYLANLRILEAKRLLHSSEMSVGEIAARLGCCDEGYFCRFFSRHTGVSPRRYRLSK